MDDIISLIAVAETQDQTTMEWIREESEPRTIFVRVESVERSEFYDAAQAGLSPEMKVVTPFVNYRGEKIAVYNETRYTVTRAYRATDSDEIQIYLERAKSQ